jgi:hypothetical protein
MSTGSGAGSRAGCCRRTCRPRKVAEVPPMRHPRGAQDAAGNCHGYRAAITI